MFKSTRLLKVVSVIMIIFSVIGIASLAFTYTMIPKMGDVAGIDTSLIEAAYSPLNIAISVVSSISCIMAGIFGVSGKSFKGAVICEGIYTVILLYNMISSVLTSGLVWTQIFSVILPLLYWWGIYQSKE